MELYGVVLDGKAVNCLHLVTINGNKINVLAMGGAGKYGRMEHGYVVDLQGRNERKWSDELIFQTVKRGYIEDIVNLSVEAPNEN